MENFGIENREEDVKQQKQLPDDVITQQILPRLPIKPLTQCKLISKEWNSCISNPEFILNHFHKSVFRDPFSPLQTLFIKSGKSYYLYSCNHDDDVGDNNLVKLDNEGGDMIADDNRDDVHVVGSSNGLVCLAGSTRNYFTLWNPTTNQSHNYYPHDFDCDVYTSPQDPHRSWGFGYVSSLDDYKVVRTLSGINKSNKKLIRAVHVFSLRSNSWKEINFGLDESSYRYFLTGRPRLVNESLYWHTIHPKLGTMILVFDLVLETFHMFLHLDIRMNTRLSVMGGWLSVWHDSTPCSKENDFLVAIQKQPGRVESVRLQCGLVKRDIDDLIGFTKSGKIIAACSKPNRLCLVDPYTAKTLVTFGDEGTLYIESYVLSQVSPLPSVDSPTATALGQMG